MVACWAAVLLFVTVKSANVQCCCGRKEKLLEAEAGQNTPKKMQDSHSIEESAFDLGDGDGFEMVENGIVSRK